MQLWIDNTQLQDPQCLESAFDLAREHAEKTGRLIIDIQADGQPIDDALLDEPPTDTAGISELKLTTTDLVAFLVETIHSAKEALALTREDQNNAADQIRTGDLEPAIGSLKAVLEGWHAVRNVVEQTAVLGNFEVQSLVVADTTGAACIESLSKALQEIRTQLEKQDWSSLGDALDCDLDEEATRWDALLDAMIVRIRSNTPPA